jgi:DNA-binding NarL/FixJ family response regulator
MIITILLADDHQIVRQGLRALLDAEPNFSVAGEAGDGLEAIEIAERLHPHVLVVDIKMPGVTGLEVVRQVRRRSPPTRAVVLSMYEDEAYVLEALRCGAGAYVLKGSSASELAHAVREVMAGRRYLSPQVARIDFDELAEPPAEDAYASLTAREREVLHLSASGLTSAQIAERLSISPRTVETHRANLMRKLSLENQSELVRYAIKRGILFLDE